MKNNKKSGLNSILLHCLLVAAAVFTLFISAQVCSASGDDYRVCVEKGYLALRTEMRYDEANEIGELYTGDHVEVIDYTSKDYWYVYSPKYDRYGYVNCNYLVDSSSTSSWIVSVDKGYLALRTEKKYDSSNEIGELYTGDMVEVINSSDSDYWYVYSTKHNRYGYVNCDYLVDSSASNWMVSVDKGYLALRTEKRYDSSNEIGELYTGDMVEVLYSSDSDYWYVYSPKLDKSGYVNKNYLKNVGKSRSSSGSAYMVSVAKGYLALRTEKRYDSTNEIGELYTGDIVQVKDFSDPNYWYVYSPKHDKYGYVNCEYLFEASYSEWLVRVNSGYLALRTEKRYDSSNEIGKLYTGDTVQVIDATDSDYWYVYSPKYDKYGYVNKDYLY